MKSRNLATALLGLVILAAACHKAPPPAPPGPVPTGGDRPAAPPTLPPPPPPVTPTNTAPATGTNDAATRTAALATIGDQIHFEYDKTDIASADAARLDRKVAILRANPSLKIRIVGHCDERGSDSYNIALGMKRALAAKDYMVRAGINASMIEIASLGRESPIDASGTEEAMAKNRRDEFEVVSGGQTIVAPR